MDRFGTILRYKAKKEIIVSAGAIDSPKLLMLSGIGPKAELAKHNINIVHEMPGVGHDLIDHCVNGHTYCSANRTGFSVSPFSLMNPLNWGLLVSEGTGPLADNGLGTLGMVHTPVNKDKVRPDMEVHTAAFGYNVDFGLDLRWKFLGWTYDQYTQFFPAETEEKSCVTVLPTINRPKSRGSIKLRSGDYKDDPRITLNYLDHPDDTKLFVEGYKFVKSMEQTKTFQEYGLERVNYPSESCDKFEMDSEDYMKCYVKSFTTTLFHPTSSCKMGPDSDKNAVVDNRLRVKGIKGLRVIDASVMPVIVGANTNAACIMIAEKGADMILQDWNEAEKGSKSSNKKKDEL